MQIKEIWKLWSKFSGHSF